MRLRVANAPTSWGIEDPHDRTNPPWSRVLDDAASAGYAGIELGPLGYFPEDGERLARELATRELALVAGYLFEPLETEAGAQRALAIAERTCRLLSAAGGERLVVIQGFSRERERSAGRSDQARRADEQEWSTLVQAVHDVARMATGWDLETCFHAHAGTQVEFEDEIERFAAETDPELVRLCVDTGHCAYAGIDPVELYRRHAGRVSYLHLKDVDQGHLALAFQRELSFNEAVVQGVFCPLGRGVVDFAMLRQALDEHDFDGWATVEQDRLPTDSQSPAEDAATSLEHLRAVGLVATPDEPSGQPAACR